MRPKLPGWTGSVGSLVFANRLDGYALEQSADYVSGTTVYATTDGGRAWRKVTFGANIGIEMKASAGEFYALLTRCRGKDTRTTTATCDSNQLGWSAAGTARWSVTTISGITSQDRVELSSDGTEVLLTYQSDTGTAPVLISAKEGRPPFAARTVPSLDSANGCGLSAMSNGAWAACGGGMDDSLRYGQRVTGPYTSIWTYPGTGGGSFDPVSGKMVYRYTGIGSVDPKLAANELQRSSNSGASFSSVGPLPFTGASYTKILFVNAEDGFALGPVVPPRGNVHDEISALFETHNGGRSWEKVTF
ncbi:MAG: hypothetical protein ACYCSF_08760 [Acidimicrobiales bacterium]